jgi:circadian clock protein KaiC
MDIHKTSATQDDPISFTEVQAREAAYKERLSTGVPELDEVLGGGLLPRRIHLVRGNPGSGKTTLGFHFLATGTKEDEVALFISIGEFEAQIRKDTASQGLDLSSVHFLDMSMSTEFPDDVEQYNATTPDDIQRETIIYTIIQQVKRLLPQRIFLDSMSQLRRLTPNAFQYRRQILAFLQSFVAQGSTILVTSESLDTAIDEDLQAICDSIINLNSTLILQ